MIDDRVSIRLGDGELEICEAYQVECAVLTQPSRFSVRLGHSGMAAELLKRYPPGTPFELRVGTDEDQSAKVFRGLTDARVISASDASTTVTFRGRDNLARLVRSTATADKTYTGLSYEQLVTEVLKDAGYKNATVVFDIAKDVQAKTGASKVPLVTRVREAGSYKRRVRKAIVHPPQIRPGERYYDFLKRILDRAGMVVYATAEGQFVVTEPQAGDPPLYAIRNRDDYDRDDVPGSVLTFDFDEDVTERFSEGVVFGRGGGGKFGRTKHEADFADKEMVGFGLELARAFVDSNVSSVDEAKLFVRRKIAESRREGWALHYQLAGHTTKALDGSRRLVWAPNTMVQIDDPQCGITGPHWIESVEFSGDADRTWTNLRLMRPEDLVFGVDVD